MSAVATTQCTYGWPSCGAQALTFRSSGRGFGNISWGPVELSMCNAWRGGRFNDTEEVVAASQERTYARVRDMLAGNPDAGTAVFQRVDGYSGVSVKGGMFTLQGDCGLGTVFGNSVRICVPYSGPNKDGIDAFLQFLLAGANSSSSESSD